MDTQACCTVEMERRHAHEVVECRGTCSCGRGGTGRSERTEPSGAARLSTNLTETLLPTAVQVTLESSSSISAQVHCHPWQAGLDDTGPQQHRACKRPRLPSYDTLMLSQVFAPQLGALMVPTLQRLRPFTFAPIPPSDQTPGRCLGLPRPAAKPALPLPTSG